MLSFDRIASIPSKDYHKGKPETYANTRGGGGGAARFLKPLPYSRPNM